MWLRAKCGHVDVNRFSHVADWNFRTHPHADEQMFQYGLRNRQYNRRHAVILLVGWCGATFPKVHDHVLRRTGGT